MKIATAGQQDLNLAAYSAQDCDGTGNKKQDLARYAGRCTQDLLT